MEVYMYVFVFFVNHSIPFFSHMLVFSVENHNTFNYWSLKKKGPLIYRFHFFFSPFSYEAKKEKEKNCILYKQNVFWGKGFCNIAHKLVLGFVTWCLFLLRISETLLSQYLNTCPSCNTFILISLLCLKAVPLESWMQRLKFMPTIWRGSNRPSEGDGAHVCMLFFLTLCKESAQLNSWVGQFRWVPVDGVTWCGL